LGGNNPYPWFSSLEVETPQLPIDPGEAEAHLRGTAELLGNYLFKLLQRGLAGDVASLTLIALLSLLVVAFIARYWEKLWSIWKKTVMAGIILVIAYYALKGYAPQLPEKISSIPLTPESLVGIGVVFVAILLLLLAIRTMLKPGQPEKPTPKSLELPPGAAQPRAGTEYIPKAPSHPVGYPTPPPATPPQQPPPTRGYALPTQPMVIGETHTQSFLTKLNPFSEVRERNMLAVFAYVIIGEFGVFSSRTIPAPNSKVGALVFIIFILATFLVVRTTYNNPRRGMRQLMAAILFAAALSLFFGHYWGGYPLSQLLSQKYFETDCLIAFITGVALSMILGSKD